MDILYLSWITLKYFLIFALLAMIYKAYDLIYIPWSLRKKYKKYPNVAMNPEFNPVVGDLISVLKNEKENKFRNQESIDCALFMPDSDFIFAQLGPQSFIYVCSKKALDEFEKYVPEAIDRHNHEGLLLANFSPKAMSLLPSNKSWDERRKHILKIIGINFASKYIPMMNQIVDDWIKEVKIGENYDLTGEINKITFRIIAKMLFGRDIDKMDFIEFTTLEDKSSKFLSFEDCFFNHSNNEFQSFYSPLGIIFPIIPKLKLTHPYSTNAKNKRMIDEALKRFLDKSTDDHSVYKQISNLGIFTKDEVFNDTLMLLIAGSDTTARGITSMIYYLYKYPETINKLKVALNTSGISSADTSDEAKMKDMYDGCDYLNYVIKEGLRIDPPGINGLFYETKRDIEICGVPLSKGTFISPSIIFPHFNSKEWSRPTDFIPERFDPESEFYFKPNTTKQEARDSKSYIPFSFGLRNCAGQTLAKMESKVILSRLITSVTFALDPALLSNDFVKFNLLSQFRLKGKILNKLC